MTIVLVATTIVCATGWYLTARYAGRRRAYRPDWHPAVRTRDDGRAHVLITKQPSPRQWRIADEITVHIGYVDIDSDSFEKELAELIDRARQKAVVLTVEQGSTNVYA